MSDQKLFSLRNPWFSASVGVTVVIAVLPALAGLIWLPLAQPDLKLSGIWDAICSAAGVPRASSQAGVRTGGFQDLECRHDFGNADAAKPGVDRPRRHAGAALRHLPRPARRQRRQFAEPGRAVCRCDLQGAERFQDRRAGQRGHDPVCRQHDQPGHAGCRGLLFLSAARPQQPCRRRKSRRRRS